MMPDKKLEKKSFIETLSKLDRRIIYWALLFAMLIPYLYPFALPMSINRYTRNFYDKVDGLTSEDNIIISLDSGFALIAEMGGGLVALPKQLVKSNVKVVGVATSPQGPLVFEEYVQPILEKAGYIYGIDFVNLGYAAGRETMMSGIAEDIKNIYTMDYYGTAIENIQMMEQITGATDFAAIVPWGDQGAYWSRQWKAKHGVDVISIETAGNYQAILPLLNSGDIFGALNGPRGCAEYEVLLNAPGMSNRSLTSMSMGHVIVILVIIIGNITYFLMKSKQSGGN